MASSTNYKKLGQGPLTLLLQFTLILLFSSTDVLTKKTLNGNGLDLIKTLNISHEVHGVIPVHGIEKYQIAWQLRRQFKQAQVPKEIVRDFLSKTKQGLSFYCLAKQARNTIATLLSISLPSHPKVPSLEIISNLRQKYLIIKYCSEKCTKVSTLKLESPLQNTSKWTRLLVSISTSEISLHTDCKEAVKVNLSYNLDWRSMRDANVYFSQGPNNKHQFIGSVQVAVLYPKQLRIVPWSCKNQTQVQKHKSENTVSEDPPQKDAINTLNSRPASSLAIQEQLNQLTMMVNMLKQQNNDLLRRVSYLETCECRPLCSERGVTYKEGQMWQRDPCTFCVCQNGRPSCTTLWDRPQCYDPCTASPCLNGGSCVGYPGYQNYTCNCPPSCYGPECQYIQNPCVYELDVGKCTDRVSRYYFDRYQMKCIPFTYTGCGGNPNNFKTLSECENMCTVGACCHRTYTSENRGLVAGGSVFSLQPGAQCQVVTITGCRDMLTHNSNTKAIEVISFQSGAQCQINTCSSPQGCTYGNKTYPYNANFRIGCQDCKCLPNSVIDCRCTTITMRKEIRDMTREDLFKFQQAVQRLKLDGPNDPWEQFRDLYITHAMHAHGTVAFLPWHRLFLRRVEQKLQEIDCSIALPYYDFTLDAGNISNSVIWQPNYFGGDGSGGCVPDHPFGTPGTWNPCIVRNFDTNIQIPSLIEVALAVKSDNYIELSRCLEAISAYVHKFIGGDMATTTAPYDPLFFAVHSYIDMMFWEWEKGHPTFVSKLPYQGLLLMPFNIPVEQVLNSEANLCVTYALPSQGHPCNETSPMYIFSAEGYNLLGFDRQGFDKAGYDIAGYDIKGYNRQGLVDSRNVYRYDGYDQFGYNRQGYDRRGFNRFGYGIDGYNRYGYDLDGYDRNGFNRYGLDRQGYNRFGYNKQGLDRQGNRGNTEVYTEEGFDPYCLNREGFSQDALDQYGYDINGYDVDFCNYSFSGPYGLKQSFRIWEIVHKQSKEFLMTIPRVCVGLQTLPQQWYEQYWFKTPKDITGMVTVEVSQSPVSLTSQSFCFNTASFLSNCPCDQLTTCKTNPCLRETCDAYPDAVCELDFCDPQCTPRWFYEGKSVDCTQELKRDYCVPNPCKNQGTCVPSIWHKEPELVTCLCPPGYGGVFCEKRITDQVCHMPLVNTGDCGSSSRRYYFNPRTQDCVEFIYTGCHGNANNFESYEACRATCAIGACCYRTQVRRGAVYGYTPGGYDRYGFNKYGKNLAGEEASITTATWTGSGRFDAEGLDWQGYDREGFNRRGYDRHGYDRQGYNRDTGFNVSGYSRIGEFDGIIDFNGGYNADGFNRAGFNCYGYNENGLDYYGLTAGYTHQCRSSTRLDCQNMERVSGVRVVKFSPGRKCSEVDCQDHCGCYYQGNNYKVGDAFQHGCQRCSCTQRGVVECVCEKVTYRKEIRDLSPLELQRYQQAIMHLQTGTDFPSKWQELARIHADHVPQGYGNQAFLPWHRYFLRQVELELQKINCDISIPYFDWTIDAGSMETSVIWQANMFGGNGEVGTECVLHHPFKSYHPPYWTPCLMRNFNTSVKLTDAVNIQYALIAESYDEFQMKMEYISGLFHQWVGGHMTSPYSPYDPIFYSHYAFIDRLWQKWQDKHPNGLLRYPAELRYVPMAPFEVCPDDVLSGAGQLCVSYVGVTEGAICNKTLPQSIIAVDGYSEDGYNLLGFDRNGYDRDGFNAEGVDRRGRPDLRGIYSTTGYDKEGYNRSGFDMMGFDRYGYRIDGFNIDHFNPAGFDRWGYNRHGFDINGKTPLGFFINSTYVEGVVEEEVNALFPYDGYNKYGIDRYGYDREGYDVFGFTKIGLDENGCNFYYYGPYYVQHKMWLDEQFIAADGVILDELVRICDPISRNPEWWYYQNWFNRENQLTLVRGVEEYMINQHPYDGNCLPRTSSVYHNGIWLPRTPVNRFCFVFEPFSGCPLSQPLVSCPVDLCAKSECVGFPDARCRVRACGQCTVEWYDPRTKNVINCMGCVDGDGVQHAEGSSWQLNPCERCMCQGGAISCSRVDCPRIDCPYPFRQEGQCCARCDGCLYRGELYSNGATFSPRGQPCEECRCVNGDVSCSQKQCPSISSCRNPITLPASCCPVCLDCGPRPNASVWQDHPCRECKCVNGETLCNDIECPPVPCTHPAVTPGQCCPKCQECKYQGRTYRSGSMFRPDVCTRCQCVLGNVECKTEMCPRLDCSNPTHASDQCCPVCEEGCKYDGQMYKNKEFFVPSFNPCLNCTCNNNKVQCGSVKCPPLNLPCRNPVRETGSCCPTLCPTCTHEGLEYNNGQEWRSRSNRCETCRCENGVVSCRPSIRCVVKCPHGVVRTGECCPDCSDCKYQGHLIPNGEVVRIRDQDCQECRCSNGYVTCQSVRVQCPRVECQSTYVPAGECCPVCKDCVDPQGVLHKHSSEWPDPLDSCSMCACREGLITCMAVMCRQVQCRNPAKAPGECCPKCDGCEYGGITFRNRDRVPSEDEQCNPCTCINGNVECERVQCPQASCPSPVTPPGECCPKCDTCSYDGRVYREGQTFTDPRDPCQTCTCRNGQVNCNSVKCNPECSHPARERDRCCPLCYNCEYERRLYRNGQEFNPRSEDPCYTCICQNGEVTCGPKQCPVLTCLDPITQPDSCCPECPPACRMEGREYSDGQTWTDPRDKCSRCTCRRGNVQCSPTPCNEVFCSHPSQRRGDCCPSCVDCLYQRRYYRNRQDFADPRDVCKQCRCRDGSVTCTKTTCPVLACPDQKIVSGQCCPVCLQGCSVGGVNYKDGETFPRGRCEQCTCANGQVICQARPCPPVRCGNPVQGECCRTCEDCFYNGVSYANFASFDHPSDKCQECRCVSGDVTCRRKSCPSVQCHHPALAPGECCPQCNDCKYENRNYRHGQTFINAQDQCQECRCASGTVTCQRKRCPPTSCSHPIQGRCCQECDRGCFYDSQHYREGQIFSDRTDRCRECECLRGTVSCRSKPCPNVQCSHPVQKECCLECDSGCFYDNQRYLEGQIFSDRTDRCRECECLRGTVSCRSKPCPNVLCSHPVQKECCQECSECYYDNRQYRNGRTFADTKDDCNECTCLGGNVKCNKKQCPVVSCSNPVQGRCCLECRNCIHNNRLLPSGDTIKDYESCQECICKAGDVQCNPLQCPAVQCPHPAKEKCCPTCNSCVYQGKTYTSGERFQDPEDPCKECECSRGFVRCAHRQCPDVNCLNPVSGPCDCKVCGGDCLYNGQRLTSGQAIPDVQDRCKECRCMGGTVQCIHRACPDVQCQHPAPGECDCPVCDRCIYQGSVYNHGDTFKSSGKTCQECTCTAGNVVCRDIECSVSCTHPVPGQGECGCPVCLDCDFQGVPCRNGQVFSPPGDPCSLCTCQSGNVNCLPISCPPVNCPNPIRLPGECCPQCGACEFNGQRYDVNQQFQSPNDLCQTCICQSGSIICEKTPCSSRCTHPVPGQCCPECNRCLFDSRIYDHGQRFKPEPCRECLCQAGSVSCTTITCEPPTCALTSQEPGECCPKCKGCTYKGRTYESGSSWVFPDQPCMSCQCLGGVVTCMEIRCVTPCPNPVPVPGQCCPMCPTCEYQGQVYNSGQVFSPEGSPCDECTCQDGQLQCVGRMCPSLVDCPREQIARPRPGECCPTCSGFGTNCTNDVLGMTIHPDGDLCVTCECLDYNWVCVQETCPVLQCPLTEQYTPPGHCCPRCAVCFVESEGVTYQDGEKWQDPSDLCVECECKGGAVTCSRVRCPQLVCNRGAVVERPQGECCEVCSLTAANTTCTYSGKLYQPNDRWSPDDCTKCECLQGKAVCTRQRCEPLTCGIEESPTLDPGKCCPKCMAKPATCIVFGDPHYHTFDGNMINFQGTCKYVMAADCAKNDFVVEVQHDSRGVQGVSWADSVTVKVAGIEVDLLQKQKVKVNGRAVSLPYLQDPHLYVEQSGTNILLNTNIGLKVIWNGDSYAEVSVPGNYKQNTCGLCGNFNSFPQDDMRLRDGQITQSEAVFGNSWKVDNGELCEEASDVDPCTKAGYNARKNANTKCEVLKGPLFRKCHRIINPEPFYASCVYDLCACAENANCLCDVLSSYALECAQAGVSLQWRSASLCAIGCPEDRGFQFDECGPPCPRTCDNYDAPLGSIEAQCFKPCVPSCQCSADKVLHENRCIQPEECPKK